ncbi:MAG: cell division protein ZapA [Bacteroidetes bacterium]|nr:MAG: cell division protein ZapA [Bacteroidota bacterium]
MKSIEVSIGGRKYPVKVTEEEEVLVLDAVKEVNQKLKDFQSTYRMKDKQDHLSMALLTYALDNAKQKGSSGLMDQIQEKTQSLFSALEAIKP